VSGEAWFDGLVAGWLAVAVATWSLPGLAFAVWTIANLASRARAHHAWCPDHPSGRAALLPSVW
jgi:3-oxo-5-alpha-steroid 4-dehydrogenase 1